MFTLMPGWVGLIVCLGLAIKETVRVECSEICGACGEVIAKFCPTVSALGLCL